MKVITVGINHAGTSMIRTLKTANPNVQVTAYDANDNISFLGCGIALWVGGEFADPSGLFYSDQKKLESYGAKIFMKHRVEAIDTKAKTVTVRNLETDATFSDEYDKLVFAGGTWPILPPIKGAEQKNILMSKLFQHAQVIKEKNGDPNVKNVVVIGAGYIGVELVEAFAINGKNVTLIDMKERPISRYFDADFTDKLVDKMKENKVNLAMGEKIVEFAGVNGKVSAVVTDKGSYPADMVIVAIGFRPQTQLLKGQVEFFENGAVITDERMRSSNKDVYAIGDAAALKHAILGTCHVALATNAVKSGIVAGLDLAGAGVNFDGIVGTNALNVFGLRYASTGISEEFANGINREVASTEWEDWDRPEFMKDKEKVKIKMTYDPKTMKLLGAQIMSWGKANHSEAIYALSLAIQKGMTLPDVALMDVYFLPHYNKPFNYILQPILNALGLKYKS